MVLVDAFNKIKLEISEDALLAFPDPNKIFVIFTDASDYQLGAVIIQDDWPVAFFSQKLTLAQQKYPTIGRIYKIHRNEGQIFFIRELFSTISWPLWFDDLKLNCNTFE